MKDIRLIAAATLSLALIAVARADAGPPAVHLWDTLKRLRSPVELAQRDAWHAATPDLQGDLVVETDAAGAAFASGLGAVLVYSTAAPSSRRAEVRPVEIHGERVTLATTVVEQSGTVMVRADFRAPGGSSVPIAFSFTGDRILAITPQAAARGVTVTAPMELAMVPSFVGEDLLFDPHDYLSAKTLSLPSEHVLVGLLRGEGSLLVMTWQQEAPGAQLALDHRAPERDSITAATLTGGAGLSLAVLDAPGISPHA